MSTRFGRRRKSTSLFSFTSEQGSHITRLWALRALVLLGGHRKFIHAHGFSDDSLAGFIGFDLENSEEFIDFDQKIAIVRLRELHAEAEISLSKVATVPEVLAKNIQRLRTLIEMTEVECRLLEFAVLIHNENFLDDAMDCLGSLSSAQAFHALSIILTVPFEQVSTALKSQGSLKKSGLISLDNNCNCPLRAKLDLPTKNFTSQILSSEDDPICWLKDSVAPSTPALLSLGDYDHVGDSLSILQPYFAQAVLSRRKGVNVLIHGAPGTGKTQLAKVLAQTLNCELFEISSQDDEGDPVDGFKRLKAYRAAQSFFSTRRVIFMFDEVEDVFSDGGFFRPSTAQNHKGWVNRMLEENMIPTVWLSNNIGNMDPAFIRRYDMVFELDTPPQSQREKILREACADMVDFDRVKHISHSEELTPAVVSRAVSVVRSIHKELGAEKTAQAVEHLIFNTLKFQGHPIPRKNDPNQLPELYELDYLQTDVDLAGIAEGLAHSRAGKLCLFGPPGTGKTAFGRWVAEQLKCPLLVKRASDLLSMYVGGTEKNIARAFMEAEKGQAILMIDEMDSFLNDRRSAIRSWEKIHVNEMLTQMEGFSGIFIASTNLMEDLDQAALRRFDLKIRFDYLDHDQAKRLFHRYCQQLSLGLPSAADLHQIGQMRNLTPGDFATVSRQHRFHPLTNCSDLSRSISAECAIKEGVGNPMGFV